MVALLVTVLVELVTVASGQCPAASGLQAAYGTRVCALLYYDNWCDGKALVVDPGTDVPYTALGYSGHISSLVVGTKCKLTVWSRSGKKGNTKVFKASAGPRLQEVKQGVLTNWDNAIKSYYCTCK